MLPETSNARITVPSTRGTPTTLCGRASATTSIVRPTRTNDAGAMRSPEAVAVAAAPARRDRARQASP